MEKYDYEKALFDDILEYIDDNGIEVNVENRDEVYDRLFDDLWIEDSVTGNGSGSYTFNQWKAEENVCHNWGLLLDAIKDFDLDITASDVFDKGAEWADVTIRCHLLGQVLNDVLEYRVNNN